MSTAALVALATILSAVVTAAITYAVALLGRATAKESGETQRWAAQLEAQSRLLEDTRKTYGDRLDALEAQNKSQAGQIKVQSGQIETLSAENQQHTDKIRVLEKVLEAARRYITDLVAILHAHEITPPPPPTDYTTD